MYPEDILDSLRASVITIALIIANVAIYFLIPNGTPLYEQMVLSLPAVSDGAWWTPVTSMFLHGSATHIVCNMLSLWCIGSMMEDLLGHWRYALVYLLSGLAGAAMVLFVDSMIGSTVGTVGASGAIFGIFGGMGYILITRYLAMRRQGIKDQAMRGQVIEFLCFLALNIVISTAPGISWEGHLGGAVFGIVATAIAWRFARKEIGM